MPHHDYDCPIHGYFEVYLSFEEEVPKELPCPVKIYEGYTEEDSLDEDVYCSESSLHVIGNIIQVKISRSWEEKANIARANPADQMKAQINSVKKAEEAREKYGDPRCNFAEGE